MNRKFKVSITLKNQKDILVYLDKQSAVNLVDQFYDLCSGQLDDNCFEVVIPNEHGNEYILIKAAKFTGVIVNSKPDAIKALKPKKKSMAKKTTKHLKSVVTKAKEAVLPVEETTEE